MSVNEQENLSARPAARPRRFFILPNLVTTANMFCGYYSMMKSMQGDYRMAAWFIIAAAIFDGLDGRVARMARATSHFGVEYDSLCDLVSFGIAPAILAVNWSLLPYDRLGWLVSFLFAACGGLRLARFNVNVDVVSKNHFQGLPIPMAASVLASFQIFYGRVLTELPQWFEPLAAYRDGFVLVMVLVLALFMVSTIPFPSFKEVHWRSRGSFGYFLAGLIALGLIASDPEIMLFVILMLYLVLSLAWVTYKKWVQREITQ